jgi:hypothetical protein
MSESSLFQRTYHVATIMHWKKAGELRTLNPRFFGGGLTPARSGATQNRSPVTVSPGMALVRGFPYASDVVQSFAIPTPSATTGHRVVIRIDWATRTITQALLSSADGVSSLPALTRVEGTRWEESVVNFTINASGVITFTTVPTQETDIPYEGYAPRLVRQGGDADDWAVPGTTNYDVYALATYCGAARWTGAAANSGSLLVTLPQTVRDRWIPQITCAQAIVELGVTVNTNNTFTIAWQTRDGSTKTSIDFSWSVLGPE